MRRSTAPAPPTARSHLRSGRCAGTGAPASTRRSTTAGTRSWCATGRICCPVSTRPAGHSTRRVHGATPATCGPLGPRHDARRLRILVADLDLLQGRSDDVLASLHSAIDAAGASGFDVELEDQARRIRGRHQLVVDPTRSLVDVVDAWIAANGGVRGEIEQLVRAALLAGDAVAASQAADLADRHALPIEAGEARIVAASLTIGADRRALAARADQQLARCGVRCWDGRLALLLALGATAASAERDESLDLLTAAELRVAEAVGDGLTNREVAAQLFLSVKTVDFHLQQIYRKLGIRSRTELVVRLTRPAAPRGTS